MIPIVRIRFGSHLYGTSTPTSDADFKSVFIPSARDILLQRARRALSSKRPKDAFEKNTPDDIDEEMLSLQQFLKLASEGQTMALDMLFAPEWMMLQYNDVWMQIQRNRHRLLTKQSASFIGYARQQANKYGIKGSRVSAARQALDILNAGLEAHGTTAKLAVLDAEIKQSIGDHSDLVLDKDDCWMWEICNRKMPYGGTIKSARDIVARIVDEYGKRALMAETQQGVDWKALSHAVRVGYEALELLTTGHITFPLPRAGRLLAIKLGQETYQDVAGEIEDLLISVEAAAETSNLPDKADSEWIEEFIVKTYSSQVMEEIAGVRF